MQLSSAFSFFLNKNACAIINALVSVMGRGDLFFARNLGLHGMGTRGSVAGTGGSLRWVEATNFRICQLPLFRGSLAQVAAFLRLAIIGNQYNTDLYHCHPLFFCLRAWHTGNFGGPRAPSTESIQLLQMLACQRKIRALLRLACTINCHWRCALPICKIGRQVVMTGLTEDEMDQRGRWPLTWMARGSGMPSSTVFAPIYVFKLPTVVSQYLAKGQIRASMDRESLI